MSFILLKSAIVNILGRLNNSENSPSCDAWHRYSTDFRELELFRAFADLRKKLGFRNHLSKVSKIAVNLNSLFRDGIVIIIFTW